MSRTDDVKPYSPAELSEGRSLLATSKAEALHGGNEYWPHTDVERLLATIADRDRKLAIAEKMFRRIVDGPVIYRVYDPYRLAWYALREITPNPQEDAQPV